MNARRALRSRLLSALFGRRSRALRRRLAECRRRLGRRPHVVDAFVELDDPYSYLLSAWLPDLAACYDIRLRVHVGEALGGVFRPEPGLLSGYAERDCALLAAEFALPFLDKGHAPPVEYRHQLLDALAAGTEEPLDTLRRYWRGDAESVARRVADLPAGGGGEVLVAGNRRLLERLGHYDCATVHYAGEWYRGVDRLPYLAARLDALGARRPGASFGRLAAIRQAAEYSLPVAPPAAAQKLPVLEYFHSFRSPYSYLAARRLFAIADAFGLRLAIRPVLPMTARGLGMPRAKRRYIAEDALREADRLGIPFGRYADPGETGIERCMAAFAYARSERRERDFLLNAGEAIWARGIDVATDAGMRKVTGRTGLFWPDARAAMETDAWRGEAESNREALYESGCWGVPVFRIGEFAAWGQDRDWLLVRHLEERCDSGEGILV